MHLAARERTAITCRDHTCVHARVRSTAMGSVLSGRRQAEGVEREVLTVAVVADGDDATPAPLPEAPTLSAATLLVRHSDVAAAVAPRAHAYIHVETFEIDPRAFEEERSSEHGAGHASVCELPAEGQMLRIEVSGRVVVHVARDRPVAVRFGAEA